MFATFRAELRNLGLATTTAHLALAIWCAALFIAFAVVTA